MTSTDHPIDKALDFLEAYLSQDFSLEEIDDHAKKLHKELSEHMGYITDFSEYETVRRQNNEWKN